MLSLYNTLAKKKEDFAVVKNQEVRLYVCGPTVYDFAHIGNLRTYLFADLLRRTLEYLGFKVKLVMNVTDIDDKIIARAEGDRKNQHDITKRYEKAFFADLKKLNILPPTKITRATEYIDQMVALVKDLLKKEFAYKGDDGSIYFSIDKFKGYGKLSGIQKNDLKIGVRVKQDDYSKENPADFALWKAYDEKDGDIFFETDLGKGRPGWHLECSAMAKAELGETIDIHLGGVDLIFPHHENEIAQSEAISGKPFSRFWLHSEHLLVDEKKMSKRLKNYYTLSDLEKHGFSPLDFRYFVLLGHYQSKLNFTWDGLTAAKNGLTNLRQNISRLINDEGDSRLYCHCEEERRSNLTNMNDTVLIAGETKKLFDAAIADNLNTPVALGILQDLISELLSDNANGQKGYCPRPKAEDFSPPAGGSKNKSDDFLTLISKLDQVLGLDLVAKIDIPKSVIAFAEKRLTAKKAGDYTLADKIRADIESSGYLIEDLENHKYHLIDK